MKPISDQPPLPLPPSQGDVPGLGRWAGDLTRQLFTFLRELSLRLNHAFTDDNAGLKTIADADLTEAEATVLTDIAQGSTPSGGDVVGPAGAADARVAVFDGGTGKLIKDGGHTLAEYQALLAGQNSFELSANLTGDRFSYIDLHADDTNTDYSARLLRQPGVNGTLDFDNAGTGAIRANGKEIATIESGSWTPTIKCSTTDPAVTYVSQIGSYVKIGKLVHVEYLIEQTALSGGVGTYVGIGGLPFTAGITYAVGGLYITYPTSPNASYASSHIRMGGGNLGNGLYNVLEYSTTAGAMGVVTPANMAHATGAIFMIGSIDYMTT